MTSAKSGHTPTPHLNRAKCKETLFAKHLQGVCNLRTLCFHWLDVIQAPSSASNAIRPSSPCTHSSTRYSREELPRLSPPPAKGRLEINVDSEDSARDPLRTKLILIFLLEMEGNIALVGPINHAVQKVTVACYSARARARF